MKDELITFEEWRDIKDFEGLYKVSNYGKVYSVKSDILLSVADRRGYNKVVLSKNGITKDCSVHRLVAIAFIPNPNKYEQVNHKDSNRKNNIVSNLEWCNASYNIKHGWEHGSIVGHNKPHTEEAKSEISKNRSGIYPSIETKIRMSKARVGKKHSNATKEKLSRANKYTRSIRNSKTGVEYSSIVEASLKEKVSQSTIYRGLKDKRYEYTG